MAYIFTRSYSTRQEPTGEVIGTLTISIPRARGFIRDRRGRKRRISDKFEIKIRNGTGGINRRSLVSQLNKEKPNFKDTVPSPKFTGKLISLLKGKY